MGVASTIKRFLDRNRVTYGDHVLLSVTSVEDIATKLGVATSSVIHTVPMNDRFGLVMAVVASDETVDFDALSQVMGRKFEPASTTQVLAVFRDCDGAFIPPLGEAYGVRTIIDDRLAENDSLYFGAGDATEIIQVSTKDYLSVQRTAWLCSNFTKKRSELSPTAVNQTNEIPSGSRVSLRSLIKDVNRLPPMPRIAQQIIRLASNPAASAKDLAKVVEIDPALAAQVMRYARSPLFGYQGEVDSIQTAISRVLGFDMVMNLALGLTTAKAVRIQRAGPYGQDSYWRHAVYSAALSQAIAAELPTQTRPKPGLAYLAGLLHNFGHLLMGHLAKKEFAKLNEFAITRPDIPVSEFESRLFDMDHCELGAWLLNDWGLNEEVVIATREHHHPNYDGPHANIVQIVDLSARMLKTHGMGDGAAGDMSPELLAKLNLTEVQALLVMNRVLEGCEGLNAMAQQMAA